MRASNPANLQDEQVRELHAKGEPRLSQVFVVELLIRALVLTLPMIPDDRPRTEKELWSEFERERPAILGALLDAVSCALRNEGEVHLPRSPRMADFACWAVAAEPALDINPGDFLRAYNGNRESANDLALEASPISSFIVALVEDCGRWEGTSSELRIELNSRAIDERESESAIEIERMNKDFADRKCNEGHRRPHTYKHGAFQQLAAAL